MRIVVVGSRTFKDKTLMEIEMGRWSGRSDIVIVSGGASGADTAARSIAHAYGYGYVEFPAEWKKYGKSAGYIRNKQMVEEERPDLVMVFYGPQRIHTGALGPDGREIIRYEFGERSKGAGHTEDLARQAGIPVEVFYEGAD